MSIIALANQKGGVGKTTSAINIGAGLQRLGKRVALVDLDPQAHLTQGLGINAHELPLTIYEVLKGEATAKEAMIETRGMDVVPADINLSGAEVELAGLAGREFLLKEALSSLRGYDYIFIDCPPSLGLLTLNTLTAAQEVFIPLQTEYLALHGIAKLTSTVELVRKRLNRKLQITGILATRFDSRKNLNREVLNKIQEHFGEKVFKTAIRDNISLAEAPGYGQTIFEYAPKSYGAKDYFELCKEISGRI